MKLNLNSTDTYIESAMEILKDNLKNTYGDLKGLSAKDLKDKLHDANAYQNLDHIENLSHKHLVILDEQNIDIRKAIEVIENGEFFWEHAAAGEATRLGLGTKYLLDLSKYTLEKIQSLILEEGKQNLSSEAYEKLVKETTFKNLKEKMGCMPDELLPLNFGTRHMLQMIYDLRKLAKATKSDNSIIKKQQMLIILNETTAEEIISEFRRHRFFTLERKNVFFMVQKSFHGIRLTDGTLFYDMKSEKRLHNHGQMFMQKLHDDEIFYFEGDKRILLKSKEYLQMIKKHKLMLSFNIEDIGYLTSAIDYHSLGLAIELSEKGYEMVMEIVRQNPVMPQKGGAAFFDKKLGRVCMIESNQLKGITNGQIEHLNKNFNIYINPSNVLEKLKQEGLPMPFDIKGSGDDLHIYFCPVQGDINFIVKTAFVIRKQLKPIQNLKSPATIPLTIKAMHEQDIQPGFKELVKELIRN